jgi:hypothetical protein
MPKNWDNESEQLFKGLPEDYKGDWGELRDITLSNQ